MKKVCVLIAASCSVFALALPANAGFTPVSAATWDDPLTDYLEGTGGILDNLYGWENLTRSDDYDAPLTDQLWFNPNGGAVARAKFAAHEHDLYAGDHFLFTTDGSYFGYVSGPAATFTSSQSGSLFRFRLHDVSSGSWWSSVQSENNLGRDHMVTWKITDNVDHPNNEIGNCVIGWEDLDLGDTDYQDLVLEVHGVSPVVPEASTLLLFGSGLSGLLFFARKKRLIKI